MRGELLGAALQFFERPFGSIPMSLSCVESSTDITKMDVLVSYCDTDSMLRTRLHVNFYLFFSYR